MNSAKGRLVSALALVGIFLFVGGFCFAERPVLHRIVGGGGEALVRLPKKVMVLVWQKYDGASKRWVDVETISDFDRSVRWVRVPVPRERMQGVVGSAKKRAGSWRLVARELGNRKFPEGFYRGPRRFGGVLVPGGEEPLVITQSVSRSDEAGERADVLESDIWKVEGGKIYYFNELRGLQVIDISDPAHPVLEADLRMPGRGQELYLLPQGSKAGVREVVLVTHGVCNGGSARILRVEVAGTRASVKASCELKGWPVDSRLIGGRLYVMTNLWEEVDGGTVGKIWRSRVGLAELDLGGGQIGLVGYDEFEGYQPVLECGRDWMAVAALRSGWGPEASEVRVYRVGGGGIRKMEGGPFSVAGRVIDRYKMDVRGEILTVISQSWEGGWRNRVTRVENFRLGDGGGVRGSIGRLELARGESLFATRFDGERAYVVTFEAVDPLWVVDLRKPEEPVVAGHLEVPGWSSHIEPVGGGKLLAIGREGRKMVASLFDVGNPAAPELVAKVGVGGDGSWSEAEWDARASGILPEAGLALVPFRAGWGEGQRCGVQVLRFDIGEGLLEARGVIEHEFEPRRAAVSGGNLISISRRELRVVDGVDLERPKVLADVSLAWPVDRVLVFGRHVLEIEDGGGWSGFGREAFVRVAGVGNPEAVEYELPVGGDRILAAAVVGERLVLLRNPSVGWWQVKSPWVRGGVWPDGGGLEEGGEAPRLRLEIYGLDRLPEVKFFGEVTLDIPGLGVDVGDLGLVSGGRDGGVVVLAHRRSKRWVWRLPGLLDESRLKNGSRGLDAGGGGVLAGAESSNLAYGWGGGDGRVWLVGVNLRGEGKAEVGKVRVFNGVRGVSGLFAGEGGLFGLGLSYQRNWRDRRMWREEMECRLVVFSVGGGGSLNFYPEVEVPGEVVGVEEFDLRGGIVWTRRWEPGDVNVLEACAWDGVEASLISGLRMDGWPVAVDGLKAYVVEAGGVRRWELDGRGNFRRGELWGVGRGVTELRRHGGALLASGGCRVWVTKNFPKTEVEVEVPPGGVNLMRGVEGDGPWLVPAGIYGVELIPY